MCYQLFSLYSKAERTAGSRIIRLNRDIDCANAADRIMQHTKIQRGSKLILDGVYKHLV